MPYQNPIRIFSPSQLEQLSPATLKKLKKEILLYFQLTDELTIERNGQEFDKNEVLAIFQTLETELEIHLHIFQNKTLRQFLQDGSLAFFEDAAAQALVLNEGQHREKINDFIADALNPVTARLMNKVVFPTLGHLENILKYCQNLTFEQQSRAYHKAYLSVQIFVERLPEDYPSPFWHEDGAVLLPELKDLVNPVYYDCFQYLPDSFQTFAFDYAMWCHNDVVNEAFERENRFEAYRRADLVTIAKAQRIGAHITQSKAFKENIEILQKYLNSEQSGSSNFWKIFKIAFIFVIVILRLSTLDSCGRSSTTAFDYQKHNFPAYLSSEKRDKLRKEISALATNSTEERMYSKWRMILAAYTGDKLKQVNAQQIAVAEKDSTLYVSFTVDILPTKVNDFAKLLSQAIRTKYLSGKEREVVFSFKDPTIPDFTLKYRFQSMIDNQGDFWGLRLKGRAVDGSSIGSSKKLDTKPLLKSELLRGTITRYEVSRNRKIAEDHFEIRRGKHPAPNPNGPVVKALNETQFDRWEDYYIIPVKGKGFERSKSKLVPVAPKKRISNNQAYKDVVLNNLFQLSFKSLTFGRYYKLENMAMVPPSNKTLLELMKKQIATVDLNGSLHYYLLSSEGQLGICAVNGKKYQLRYLISFETKRIIGLHMVSLSENSKTVELIKVFF